MRQAKGFTFVELLVTVTVLAVLASVAVPIYRWDAKRRREVQLRVTLQTMRDAIDLYNQYMAANLILTTDVEQCALPADRTTCYPRSLEELVEGVEVGDPQAPRTIKFLQRMPIDPMTGEEEWGMRSYQDDWDSRSWGRENLYDVYSLSSAQALDGTYYRDW
jgi:general secretion pathway protein G